MTYKEQKFYIQRKLSKKLGDKCSFVNEVTRIRQGVRSVNYELADREWFKSGELSWKTQFTNQEFEEIIPEEYRCNFELIPVEEGKNK